MSSVNVAEVAKFLIEQKNCDKDKVSAIIQGLVAKIIPFDTELAFVSAGIINHNKSLGLSLGDRACIAVALVTGYPVYTADKAWAQLRLDCEIIIIR